MGYAIAHPEMIAAIDKTLFPFAVSALAQAAALAAIDAEEQISAGWSTDDVILVPE